MVSELKARSQIKMLSPLPIFEHFQGTGVLHQVGQLALLVHQLRVYLHALRLHIRLPRLPSLLLEAGVEVQARGVTGCQVRCACSLAPGLLRL